MDKALGIAVATGLWWCIANFVMPEDYDYSKIGSAFTVTLFFAAVSIVRGYMVRRIFDYWPVYSRWLRRKIK